MTLIDYMEGYKILDRYGIRSVESGYVESADEAVKFSRGKSIVLKAISQNAVHKSRSGLVALNLSSDKEIRSAYGALTKRAQEFKPFKVLAQHMAKSGVEVIIGGNTDQQFGKLILMGLGGIYVETFKDVATRVCPISRRDAMSMLMQLRSHKIIAPDPAAEKRVIGLLLKISKMFENTDIKELDLNPVIMHSNGYEAVDIRMID
jgi:succinyl-CoA synthetase beta subunit